MPGSWWIGPYDRPCRGTERFSSNSCNSCTFLIILTTETLSQIPMTCMAMWLNTVSSADLLSPVLSCIKVSQAAARKNKIQLLPDELRSVWKSFYCQLSRHLVVAFSSCISWFSPLHNLLSLPELTLLPFLACFHAYAAVAHDVMRHCAGLAPGCCLRRLRSTVTQLGSWTEGFPSTDPALCCPQLTQPLFICTLSVQRTSGQQKQGFFLEHISSFCAIIPSWWDQPTFTLSNFLWFLSS